MTQDAAHSGESSTYGTAREQAAGVAQGAAESGHRLVDQAKEQVGEVGREAGRQAKDVLGQGRTELTEQAAAQQRKVAGGLRSFSQELGSMARSSDQPGLATDLAHQVATRADAAATWLDEREPGALLEEVKTFARNRPGAFLAVAVTAGVLAGRLTRGLKDAATAPGGASGGVAGADSSGAAHRAPGAPLTGAASTAPGVLDEPLVPGVSDQPVIPGVPERTSAYGAGPVGGPVAAPTTRGSAEDTMAYGTSASSGSYIDPLDPLDRSPELDPDATTPAYPAPDEDENR